MTFSSSSLDFSKWSKVVVNTALSFMFLLWKIPTSEMAAFGRAVLMACLKERGVVVGTSSSDEEGLVVPSG